MAISNNMHSICGFVCCMAFLASSSSLTAAKTSTARVNFLNLGDDPIEIHWVDPKSGKPKRMNSFQPDDDYQLGTFVGHRFELRQMPDESTGECKTADRTCRIGYFTVEDADEQMYKVMKDMTIVAHDVDDVHEFIDSNDEAVKAWNNGVQPTLEDCRDLLEERLELAGQSLDEDGDDGRIAQQNENSSNENENENDDDDFRFEEALDMYYACLEAHAAIPIKKINDEIEFQSEVRTITSDNLENFTCDDANTPESPDVEQREWKDARTNTSRIVHVKFDRPASRIHVIEDFASPEECQAMADQAEPKLARATVTDGKGGNQFSENRKAMQAGIKPDWSKEQNGDLVCALSRRVYDYTNHVLGYNIQPNGQENLMSIQYFGRGYNDTQPDRYTPHCDGGCAGRPYQPRTRMATMVIYCTIPERGGHTNFQNANVHVVPKEGSALFFSYIDPKTNTTDDHLTQHSGCPTYEGEKKIVTQWIRMGVDDETPWSSLNTLGIKKSESDE